MGVGVMEGLGRALLSAMTFFKPCGGWDLNSDMVCCDFPYLEEELRFGMRLDWRRVFG